MRKFCILCGGKLFDKPLYVFENMPAEAQNLPDVKQLEEDKPINYNFKQCSKCGLTQFDCDPVSYYKDSTRAGERCEALKDLRRKQYSYMIEKFSLQGKKIIEIGAGKGGFLLTLQEMSEYNIKAYGIEYNRDFVETARKYVGDCIFQGDVENVNTIVRETPFDAFVSFAYPARLMKPNDMMQWIYNNTTEDAVGLIQVPSLEHLMSATGFYDITRDHIAYYDRNTLSFLIQKNGFEVIEMDEVSELYIYAYVKKRKSLQISDMWAGVKTLRDEVVQFVSDHKGRGEKIAIWCAGHFAFTLLSVTGMAENISYVIDNAVYKQGKYTPATHVKIVAPEYYKKEPVDVIMILGPIYVAEIVDEIKRKCSRDIVIASVDKNGLHCIP